MNSLFFIESSSIVLQGEVSVSDPDRKITKIKAPILTDSYLLTLYHPGRKIAALANIDRYTSILSVMNTIERRLQTLFEISVRGNGFKARLVGANPEDPSSNVQKASILSTLKKIGLVTKWEELGKMNERSQMYMWYTPSKEMNNYKHNYSINNILEEQQKYEYYKFSQILSKDYQHMTGSEIPLFKAKLSKRYECIINEPLEEITKKEKDTVSPIFLDPTNITDLLENQDIPVDAKRSPIETKKNAENLIWNHISDHFKENETFEKAFKENRYNDLLRRSASSAQYLSLLKLLLKHAEALSIDLTDRDKDCESVWDVAKKEENNRAIKILNLNAI